ncbi:DUF3450 domain-containing protein [Microbulbifer rhizosphaerae]|uniref:DUF3450 domain-containing protein n=1 Tax=Microbulbifer rhizosphaerae TaxID=1562603 RepID=A0A7W4WES7_9GAMM|nr:DUF3450 domain-containing protein [Microbulbifer rhizosphaerae]MBB3062889.1 hypothetical protein [Microbulbifer rhizosphaerae]
MYKNICTKVLAAALALFSAATIAQTPVLTAQAEQDKAAAQSQKRIDKLDEQTTDAFQQYRAALARAESLDIYNQQLRRLVDSQKQEIASVQRQTEQIEGIETGALPFMITMTDTLADLVAADVPFLLEEREARVAALRGLIDRADVSAGEKYRRIMEAYTVEAEYGRTIEAYRGELDLSGESRSVDFLRLGRVGLFYQTLDGGETGRWNAGLEKWELLGDDYRRSVRDGLRIARKQAPPALLKLPFNTPEAGR